MDHACTRYGVDGFLIHRHSKHFQQGVVVEEDDEKTTPYAGQNKDLSSMGILPHGFECMLLSTCHRFQKEKDGVGYIVTPYFFLDDLLIFSIDICVVLEQTDPW